jgi:hypothetical protein
MRPPNEIPRFNNAHLAQTPIIGQKHQQLAAQIQAAMGQLSMGIYSQLAIHHVTTMYDGAEPNADTLRALAKHAQTAARAYFEGLGIIEHEKAPEEDK